MNWSQLIRDLQGSGMTQEAIATAIGKSQPWVSDVARSQYAGLKWSDGEALKRLHAEKCERAAA